MKYILLCLTTLLVVESSRISKRSGLFDTLTETVSSVGAYACPKRAQAGKDKPYGFADDECCNQQIELLLKQAIGLASNIPKLGDIAKHVQRFVQKATGKSIEIVISDKNFAISTYYQGSLSCRVRVNNKIYAIYATPQQYDINNAATEDYFNSLDARDPLGGTALGDLSGKAAETVSNLGGGSFGGFGFGK